MNTREQRRKHDRYKNRKVMKKRNQNEGKNKTSKATIRKIYEETYQSLCKEEDNNQLGKNRIDRLKATFLALVITLSAILSGCATTITTYKGGEKQTEVTTSLDIDGVVQWFNDKKDELSLSENFRGIGRRIEAFLYSDKVTEFMESRYNPR